MSNFVTLYLYELKKICKRKIVWITLGILIGFTVFMGMADALTRLYTMTVGEDDVTLNGFEYLAYAKENAMSISGREIDDSMLEEVKAAYAGMHEVEAPAELLRKRTGTKCQSPGISTKGSFSS